MSMTCEPLLAALKECLLASDCVIKQGHLPSECLRDHTSELPERCLSIRKATFECKRGLLDMRKRFRGNNAGAVAQKLKESPPSQAE
ncbi:cytochrome c oxidase assembly protein PET191-domain-containing protein [Phanerochaete sordida]|uniref:Cytochrome c oxidase assembly protein PET191-domain-containing protein n=1 Tax=Phanerochaete sordida TaxID=48140 RepID=A0A9P3L7M2_9APHY|nr:cytochrome c oxidase assembly protein PET191-domain-containing protein [Phanerochaete sordida]